MSPELQQWLFGFSIGMLFNYLVNKAFGDVKL